MQFGLKGKIATFVIVAAVVLTGCGPEGPKKTGAQKDTESRTKTVEGLINKQPVAKMDYSPTRTTINAWAKTWGHDPNKLAFVYMRASTGQILGYYVFKGPPVSMCAGITQPWQKVSVDGGQYGAQVLAAAPGLDGVYYSGGQCDVYYGIDASTGAYTEFSIGGGLNYQLSDKPLPAVKAEPLAFTSVDEAKALK